MVIEARNDKSSKFESHLSARRKLFFQFSARLLPRHPSFHWPEGNLLFLIQDDLINDLGLADTHTSEGINTGNDAYLQSFLKELLARLEKYLQSCPNDEEELEINGDLLALYATLMATANAGKPGARTVTHYLPGSGFLKDDIASMHLLPGWQAIQIEEEGTTISRGTTGLKTWEASLRLAGHLFANPSLLTNLSPNETRKTTILELGCGVGFLGVVARLLSPTQHRIIMTDLEGEVLEKTRKTVKEHWNENKGLEVQSLDWIEVQEEEEVICHWLDEKVKADIVLAADIVFDPSLIKPLCSVLSRILHSRKEEEEPVNESKGFRWPFALIASTVRNPSTFQLFRETLASFNLDAVEADLQCPKVDLNTLQVNQGEVSFDADTISLFPSSHVAATDGQVKLMHITSKV